MAYQAPLITGIKVNVPYISGMIYGGPFHDYVPGQRRLKGVKMAVEIDKPCDISIPTKDYDVPPVDVMQKGLIEALVLLSMGNDLYVGCMGGVGRTGLFMACFARVANVIENGQDSDLTFDPVKFVRGNYKKHAVETAQQKDYVADFDIGPVLKAYDEIKAMHTITKTVEVEKIVEKVVEKPVEVIKEVVVYLTPLQWLLDLLARFWASLAGNKKS